MTAAHRSGGLERGEDPKRSTGLSQPDLRAHLEAFWRRRWVLVICTVAVPLLAYLIAGAGPRFYESSVLIQTLDKAVDTSLFSGSGGEDQSLEATARLIQTTAVARAAARRLRPRPTPASLLGQIVVTPDEDSGFLTITARDADPQRAAAIANAFAVAFRGARSAKARARITLAMTGIEEELTRIDDPEAKLELSRQLQRLRALRSAQGNSVQVIEPAVPSSSPVSRQRGRNTGLGIVLGILLGIGLVFLLEAIDRRIREPEELERLTGTPLLAVVPVYPLTGPRPSPSALEAFKTLRASLTYFNIDRPLRNVAICSSGRGEGKTTVAAELAKAVARAGRDVILVDTDLRHPRIADRMQTPNGTGLVSVLTGERSLDDAVSDMEIEPGRLRVLPAGPSPPNSAELIASDRMRSLTEELSAMSDLVIFDSPPTLEVSDAIPLFDQVSGVVVVCRIGQTTRQAIRRLVSVIETAGGTPLGVVAIGTRGGGGYGYGYGYGYGHTAANGKPSRGEKIIQTVLRR